MTDSQTPAQSTPTQGVRWASTSIEVHTKVGITSSSGNNYQVLLKRAY